MPSYVTSYRLISSTYRLPRTTFIINRTCSLLLKKWCVEEIRENSTKNEHLLTQVNSHEEIGGGQIADEKPRNVHLAPGEYEDKDDGAVTQHGAEEDDPDAAPQRPPVEEILAGEKRPGQRQTLDLARGAVVQAGGPPRDLVLGVLLHVRRKVAGVREIGADPVPQRLELFPKFVADVLYGVFQNLVLRSTTQIVLLTH